jgi:hypothetical protein
MNPPDEQAPVCIEEEVLDPNDSERPYDHHMGQTIIHAFPPRLEDEGQCGG